jgi:hypothetical protein
MKKDLIETVVTFFADRFYGSSAARASKLGSHPGEASLRKKTQQSSLFLASRTIKDKITVTNVRSSESSCKCMLLNIPFTVGDISLKLRTNVKLFVYRIAQRFALIQLIAAKTFSTTLSQ